MQLGREGAELGAPGDRPLQIEETGNRTRLEVEERGRDQVGEDPHRMDLRRTEPGRREHLGQFRVGEPALVRPAVTTYLGNAVLGSTVLEYIPGLAELTGQRASEYGGVPLADQDAECSLGRQGRADGPKGVDRISDQPEDLVAEDQIDGTGYDQIRESGQVPLVAGDPVGHAVLVGTSVQGRQRIGARVDDRDPVAELGETDREPAGPAPDVEDFQTLPPSEVGQTCLPHDGRADRGPALQRSLHAKNSSARHSL